MFARSLLNQTTRVLVTPKTSSFSLNGLVLRSFSTGDEKEYAPEIQDILKDYEERKKRRQAKVGTVVSVKNSKSISVKIDYKKFIPKYNAYLNRSKKIMAHDELEKAKFGDVVRIVPCAPKSASKRHMLIDIIKVAPEPEDAKLIRKETPKEAEQQA